MDIVKKQEEKAFPATVVKIINSYKVVINKGAIHNVNEGQRFLIYEVEKEEIIDPTTGKSLGYLEIIKGTGKVSHVQELISTIESDDREASRRTIRRSPFTVLSGLEEEVNPGNIMPFKNPAIGDKAKPI